MDSSEEGNEGNYWIWEAIDVLGLSGLPLGLFTSSLGDNEAFPCISGHGAVFTHSLLLLSRTRDTECYLGGKVDLKTFVFSAWPLNHKCQQPFIDLKTQTKPDQIEPWKHRAAITTGLSFEWCLFTGKTSVVPQLLHSLYSWSWIFYPGWAVPVKPGTAEQGLGVCCSRPYMSITLIFRVWRTYPAFRGW